LSPDRKIALKTGAEHKRSVAEKASEFRGFGAFPELPNARIDAITLACDTGVLDGLD
jgi:hypothetical protein